MRYRMAALLMILHAVVAGTAQAQSHRSTRPAETETPEIVTVANTYRLGKVQYATAIISVRTKEKPNEELAYEVGTCQVTAPVKGELANGRRTYETACSASWPIDSDSDAAMKDFEVTGSASSADIGDLRSVQHFKYSEMGSGRTMAVKKLGKIVKRKGD